MEKIIAAIASAAALIAAFVLGRRTGSGSNDRQRDIRRAFDDIGKTAEEVGDAGDRVSEASAGIGRIEDRLGDAVNIAESGRADASRQDELIAELSKRASERSQDSQDLEYSPACAGRSRHRPCDMGSGAIAENQNHSS